MEETTNDETASENSSQEVTLMSEERLIDKLSNIIEERVRKVLHEETQLSDDEEMSGADENRLLYGNKGAIAQKYNRDTSAQHAIRDTSAQNSNSRDTSAHINPLEDTSASDQNPREDLSASPQNADQIVHDIDNRVNQMLTGPEDENSSQISTNEDENTNFLNDLKEEMASNNEDGEAVDEKIVDIIRDHFMIKSSMNNEITKAIKEFPIPKNLGFMRPPKLNPELQSSKRFALNEGFILSNERNFYTSSNMIHRTLSIFSNMVNTGLKALPNKNGESTKIDPKKLVKDALAGITISGALAADIAQKRRNNVRKICHDDFKSLCGPKPGSFEAKKKMANKGFEFLLGDNLKEASKDAKRGADICKSAYKPFASSSSPSGGKSGASYRPYPNQGFRRGGRPNSKYRGQNYPSQKNFQSSGYNRNPGSNSTYRSEQDFQSNRQNQPFHQNNKPYQPYQSQYRNNKQ